VPSFVLLNCVSLQVFDDGRPALALDRLAVLPRRLPRAITGRAERKRSVKVVMRIGSPVAW
jgi:hypothetical protein